MRYSLLAAVLILVASPSCDKGGDESPGTEPAVDTSPALDFTAAKDSLPSQDSPKPQDTPKAPDSPATEFPVEIGQKVPNFSLPATGGNTFTLSDYEGKRVLISAFPAATTSVCTIQTCYVNDHFDEFIAMNTVPVGFSTDTLATLDEWVEAESYQQLLLSDADPKGAVSEMLGIYDLLGVTKRSNLILDENRVLVWKRVYAMGETPNFEEVHEFLEDGK